jgi:hypothetical protein
VPRPSDVILADHLAKGETFEARVDGDLNGDGDADVAFVGRAEESRHLYVMMAYRTPVDFGHEPAGRGPLEPDALGNADLKIARGVLTVTDLTGGTSATQVTYRLRWEPATKRMRVIGRDTFFYSRSWAHDGAKTSWNLLTGVQTRQVHKLVAPGDPYAPGPVVTSRRPTLPVYIDRIPGVAAISR